MASIWKIIIVKQDGQNIGKVRTETVTHVYKIDQCQKVLLLFLMYHENKQVLRSLGSFLNFLSVRPPIYALNAILLVIQTYQSIFRCFFFVWHWYLKHCFWEENDWSFQMCIFLYRSSFIFSIYSTL